MPIAFLPIPTETARAYRSGAPDAYGNPPERVTCTGHGAPCRHCLDYIPVGAEMLILAHSPFGARQPYAETGPIFLCADPCNRGGGAEVPEALASPDYLVKGYSAQDRIVYGTGAVVATPAIPAMAERLLADPRIAYVHVRSARNNCYQARIDRPDPEAS